MEIKAAFGLLSSFFVLLGTIPYLIDIKNKKVRPHILSWLGWGFITGLGASAMIAEGSTWATAILWANSFFCLVIALYAAKKKVGVWSTTIYDYVFFALGVIGLVLWQTLNLPILALVCAILADLFFGIPTIIKTFKDSKSETRLVWMFACLSGLFGLFAINSLAFHEAAYPIYLLFYDTFMLALVIKSGKARLAIIAGVLIILLGAFYSIRLPQKFETFKNLIIGNYKTQDNFSITIDKIGVKAPVLLNVDPTNEAEYDLELLKGVAHMTGSKFPGEKGNVFIYGHSSAEKPGAYDKIFAKLDDLRIGDKILVNYNNKIYNYSVSEKKIVEKTDFSVLENSDKKMLTLMTCWPIGTTDQRLIIKALQEE